MYIIYGLNWCIFCVRAMNLLHEKGKTFTYNSMDDSEENLERIKEKFAQSTVPVIVNLSNGEEELIGGYDDLVKHIRQQEDKKSNQFDNQRI